MSDKSSKEDMDCWPDFYPPELELPPVDAVDAEGVVYRLVASIPPTSKCFLSTHEENPQRCKKNYTLQEKQMVFGTSVWDSKDFLLEASAYLPEALRLRKLASGKLSAGMGKMKRTSEQGHITLWLRKGSNIHLSFSEVK